VREAVLAGGAEEIFVTTTGRERHREIVALAEAAGIRTTVAHDQAVAALSETVTPQGLVAVCRALTVSIDDALAGMHQPGRQAGTHQPGRRPRLVVVLVEVRDPGNVGAVIRGADAAGADAVLLTHGCVDPQGGKAVRASAGSVFHLPVSDPVDIDDAIVALRHRGLRILAADGAARMDLGQAEDADLLSRPTAWLFGNEARGLPDHSLALADDVVRIPIYGRAESLNLAVAAVVCLYASARAQRAT
jgi:TrmH family RNA methyltransferase